MKRVILGLICVMMMTLVGCGTNSSKDEKALKYLEKKYAKAFNDEFEIASAEYADFFHGIDTFYIKSKSLPDNIIEVSCQKGDYSDNYIPLYYLKESEKALEELVEPFVGECKVVCAPMFYTTDEFSKDTTFEEYIHSDLNQLSSSIIIKDAANFSDSNIDKILEKLKQLNIHQSSLHFVVLDEYKEFENYKEYDQYVDQVRYPYIESRYIALNKDYEVTSRDKGPSWKIKE